MANNISVQHDNNLFYSNEQSFLPKSTSSLTSSLSSSNSASMIIITNEVNESIVIIAYSLIVIISLIGNSLVIKIAFSGRRIPGRSQRSRTTTDVLIGSLSLSDIVMTIFNIPFNLARILLPHWPFGRILCYGVPFVQTACVYVSTFTMAAIALHRWRMVLHPTTVLMPNKTSHGGLRSPLRSSSILTRTIMFVWLLSFGLAAPTVAFNTLKLTNVNGSQVIRCRVNYPTIYGINVSLLLTIGIFLTQYLIPLVITGVLYLKIAIVIHRQSRFTRSTGNVIINNANIQTQPSSSCNPNKSNNNNNNNQQTSLALSLSSSTKQQSQLLQPQSQSQPSTIITTNNETSTIVNDSSNYESKSPTPNPTNTAILMTMVSDHHHGKRRRQLEMKRRRILMLSLVVAVFAICWLPLNLYHLIIDLGLGQHRLTVFLVCHWFAMSSVCYNSFIYCWLNENFRQNALELLRGLASNICRFSNKKKNNNNNANDNDAAGANDFRRSGFLTHTTSGMIATAKINQDVDDDEEVGEDENDDEDDEDAVNIDNNDSMKNFQLKKSSSTSNKLSMGMEKQKQQPQIIIDPTQASITSNSEAFVIINNGVKLGTGKEKMPVDYKKNISGTSFNNKFAKYFDNALEDEKKEYSNIYQTIASINTESFQNKADDKAIIDNIELNDQRWKPSNNKSKTALSNQQMKNILPTTSASLSVPRIKVTDVSSSFADNHSTSSAIFNDNQNNDDEDDDDDDEEEDSIILKNYRK